MASWQQRLKVAFKKSKKSVIIGIGNDMKADDGIGPYIIDQLQENPPSNIELINAGTVPENFFSSLINSQPSLVLLIDAALMQAKPGTIRLLDKSTIGGVAFSTHQLPLTFFIEYLELNIPTSILILGIQPLTDEFAQPLSAPAQTAAHKIIEILNQILH